MKIKINNKDVCVVASCKRNLTSAEVVSLAESMEMIIDYIAEDDSKPIKIQHPVENIVEKAVTQDNITHNNNRPLFRDRIPNNIVDMKNVTFKKAKTKNVLVRCPDCGQSHCAALENDNHVYLLERDFAQDELKLIMSFDTESGEKFDNEAFQKICKPEGAKEIDYFNDLQKLLANSSSSLDYVTKDNAIVYCPVCKYSMPLFTWINAYNNPEEYAFEYNDICPVCGGEVVEHLHTDKTVSKVCENCSLDLSSLSHKEDKHE